MRAFILILISISTLVANGQTGEASQRFMTYTQNTAWLESVKSLHKPEQWREIKARFFLEGASNAKHDSVQYCPMIIINGVLLNLPEKSGHEYNEKILSILTDDSILDIIMLTKISEYVIFCRPASGVILFSVDKKTDKKLAKLTQEWSTL